MKKRFPEITEAVTLACSTPDSHVFVCMRSEEETAKVITLAQQLGYTALGTTTTQEMLERAVINPPWLLVVYEDISPQKPSSAFFTALKCKLPEWEYDNGPSVLLVIPPQPPSSDIKSRYFTGYYRGADMILELPFNNDCMLVFLNRLLYAAASDDDNRYVPDEAQRFVSNWPDDTVSQ